MRQSYRAQTHDKMYTQYIGQMYTQYIGQTEKILKKISRDTCGPDDAVPED